LNHAHASDQNFGRVWDFFTSHRHFLKAQFNGFPNIRKCFLNGFTLREATWKEWANCHKAACLIRLQNDWEI